MLSTGARVIRRMCDGGVGMNVKPIIFSTKMVQAILGGRKTQTRRVMKPQPESPLYKLPGRDEYFFGRCVENNYHDTVLKQPYQPGDILWVRETWGYARGGLHPEKGIGYSEILYKATDDSDDVERWRSSRYMPKEVARIYLRVTDVRAERVQDITEEGAMEEGFPHQFDSPLHPYDGAAGAFIGTWDNLNAKRGYGWDKNPWVWIYTFERVEKPEGWRYDR